MTAEAAKSLSKMAGLAIVGGIVAAGFAVWRRWLRLYVDLQLLALFRETIEGAKQAREAMLAAMRNERERDLIERQVAELGGGRGPGRVN